MTRLLNKQEEFPYPLLLLADETKEAINRYIYDAELYVYERAGEIIAVYALYPINSESIEIKNIAVKESEQGKGIGSLLLDDATQRAKEKQYQTLLIGTANSGIKQLYLYQKNGFEIYDIKKNFFIDNYPEPIYENGILLNHMIMLRKDLITN